MEILEELLTILFGLGALILSWILLSWAVEGKLTMGNFQSGSIFSNWKIWLVLVTLGGVMWWCHQTDQNVQDKRNQTKMAKMAWKEAVTAKSQELQAIHNAKLDWIKEIPVDAFTMDIQKALIGSDDQPILFSGTVKDVLENEGQFQIEVINEIPWQYPLEEYSPSISIRFLLDGTQEMVDRISAARSNRNQENLNIYELEMGYVFIAKINQIKKVGLQLGTEVYGEDDFPSAEVILEDSDKWVALGTLVDIQPFPPWPKRTS